MRSQGAPLTRSSEVDILLPKLPSLSTAAPPTPERKRPPPGSKRQGLPLELVHGVAGSRKTQHLIDVAVKAMKQGEAKRLLFLVKVRVAGCFEVDRVVDSGLVSRARWGRMRMRSVPVLSGSTR